MMSAIIGVLSLGMVAVIVSQLVRAGSQGPAFAQQVLTGIANVYGSLMK